MKRGPGHTWWQRFNSGAVTTTDLWLLHAETFLATMNCMANTSRRSGSHLIDAKTSPGKHSTLTKSHIIPPRRRDTILCPSLRDRRTIRVKSLGPTTTSPLSLYSPSHQVSQSRLNLRHEPRRRLFVRVD